MNVTIFEKPNKSGTVSIWLNYIQNGKRIKEATHITLYNPKATRGPEYEANKEKRILAERIRANKMLELTSSDHNLTTNIGKKTLVVDWMQNYLDNYTLKDKRNIKGALEHFKKFLKKQNINNLVFSNLTEVIIMDYQDYLLNCCSGDGSASYFRRFKKMIKRASKERLMPSNPATDVKTISKPSEEKDTLSIEEIQTLAKTGTKNTELKRAFLFSCLTGLRWCDVKALDWDNINLKTKQLILTQRKTERPLKQTLNDIEVALIRKEDDPKGLVFDLPSHTGALKTLRAWVKRAGITKLYLRVLNILPKRYTH